MAELRSVDPKSLIPNPNNPRRTKVSKDEDAQLAASIRAVGLIQPPRVVETKDGLMVVAGNRRRAAAVAAGLETIDVMVCDADEAADAMRAMSENVVRAPMNSVDTWRAIEALGKRDWTDDAIATALSAPVRTVQKLKLLGQLHPPMLDAMAKGDEPGDRYLRVIAAASLKEQAQVWKKNKPGRGEQAQWYSIAQALQKRQISFVHARFGEDLARAYGVNWHDDLFVPAGTDGRYTTDAEGFFCAQQEWLQGNLPKNAVVLPTGEYGNPVIPKGAQQVYYAAEGDLVGFYIDQRSGEVKQVSYRMPKKERTASDNASLGSGQDGAEAQPAKARPTVTQKGQTIIGDLRTKALHQAIQVMPLDDSELIGLLVLAFAGQNVRVEGMMSADRSSAANNVIKGNALTDDAEAVRAAAKRMLISVLSCRTDRSDSGPAALVAGNSINASSCLPNMATDEFLSCLSKQAIEKAAIAENVQVEIRGKDTRARMLERFKDKAYVYPEATFNAGLGGDKAGWTRSDDPEEDEGDEQPADDLEEASRNAEGDEEEGEEDGVNASGDDEDYSEESAEASGDDAGHGDPANDAMPYGIAAE